MGPAGHRIFRRGRIFHVVAPAARTTGHSRTTGTGATVRDQDFPAVRLSGPAR